MPGAWNCYEDVREGEAIWGLNFGLIYMHDSIKRGHSASESSMGNCPRPAFNTKLYRSPVVRHAG